MDSVASDLGVKDIKWAELELDRINPLLGAGSFGKVIKCNYKKSSTRAGMDVAVKIMTSSAHSDFSYIKEMTIAEAAVIHHAGRRVETECVVRLIGISQGVLPNEWCQAAKLPFDESAIGLVMSYEAGGSLEHLLYKNPQKPNLLERCIQ